MGVAPAYKAIVCIMLEGGMDNYNTLPPFDAASYGTYAALRGSLAHPKASLTAIVPSAAPAGLAGAQYAFSPSLAPVFGPLFTAGKLGVLLNIGALTAPITKAQYNAASVGVPPKLFSHNDQQTFIQTSSTEGAASGIGGRFGDVLRGQNPNPVVTCITHVGNTPFQAGAATVQYGVGIGGPAAFSDVGNLVSRNATIRNVFDALVGNARSPVFEDERNRIFKRARDNQAIVAAALATYPNTTTAFPATTLGNQLKIAARMIACSDQLGPALRQIFFVRLGGFDHHDGLATALPPLHTQIANAMKAFYDEMGVLSASNRVVQFTMSDFGRTLVVNGDGTDHGWGGHHFVLGGSVAGGKFYGSAPVHANDGVNDCGQGRLIPTTGFDQLLGTLGKWLGMTDAEVTAKLPYIANFPQPYLAGLVA